MKIFITGSTGFLGYNIAKECLNRGYHIACLKRTKSINPFSDQENQLINWINSEEDNIPEQLSKYKPDVLIHAAWGGVSAKDRNDPNIQKRNIEFSKDIFSSYPYWQIISLGSQDEYGNINSVVDEKAPLSPISEYAKAKIKICRYLKAYSEKNGIKWQWLRIFSVYGTMQKRNWAIPAIIYKCMEGEKEMDTTECRQKYAYLYSSDFSDAVLSVIRKPESSGIYNLSSSEIIELRKVFKSIKELTGSDIRFNWGKVPYREKQSMIIAGDSSKFINTFGSYEKISLEDGLKKMISYYKNESI